MNRNEGKDQESILSNTTPDLGHRMVKWQKHKKHHIQESKEVSFFPVGDHKDAMNRQDSITDKHETHITEMIHKRSTPLERSVRKLPEGLNMFKPKISHFDDSIYPD